MFHVEPDAWANTVAVITICISIFHSIMRKLTKKRTKANALWFYTELSFALLVALIAWQMHPHLNSLPDWATRGVFTALAIHGSARFIQALQDRVLGPIK